MTEMTDKELRAAARARRAATLAAEPEDFEFDAPEEPTPATPAPAPTPTPVKDIPRNPVPEKGTQEYLAWELKYEPENAASRATYNRTQIENFNRVFTERQSNNPMYRKVNAPQIIDPLVTPKMRLEYNHELLSASISTHAEGVHSQEWHEWQNNNNRVEYEAWCHELNSRIELLPRDIEGDSAIPEFPEHVIRGFYKEVVDLVCHNNTLPPAFVMAITRAILAAFAAGRLHFSKGPEVPTYMSLLIATSGESKGEVWRRLKKMLLMAFAARFGVTYQNDCKNLAKLEELFEEATTKENIASAMLYWDELLNFTTKVKGNRAPEIMSAVLGLANDTSLLIPNVACYLSMILCGQPDYVETAFMGTHSKVLGFYNRLKPEVSATSDILGALEVLDDEAMTQVRSLFTKIPLEGKVTFSDEAERVFNDFWKSKTPEYRTARGGRGVNSIYLDAGFQAIGQYRLEVSGQDMQDAFDIYERENIIRDKYLVAPTDNTKAFYIAKLKGIAEKMQKEIDSASTPLERVTAAQSVAKTYRELEIWTNARRDNHETEFRAAWNAVKGQFTKFTYRAKNGVDVDKFYPADLE